MLVFFIHLIYSIVHCYEPTNMYLIELLYFISAVRICTDGEVTCCIGLLLGK